MSNIAERIYRTDNPEALRQFIMQSTQGNFSGQAQPDMLNIIFGILNIKSAPMELIRLSGQINAIIQKSAKVNTNVFLELLKSEVGKYPTLPQRAILKGEPPTRYSSIKVPTSIINRNNLIHKIKEKRQGQRVYGYEIATWRGGAGKSTKHGAAATYRTESQRLKRNKGTAWGRNWFSTPSNAAYTYFLWAFEFGWATKETAKRVKRDMDLHLGKGKRNKFKYPTAEYTKIRAERDGFDLPVGVLFGLQERKSVSANRGRPGFAPSAYLDSSDIGTAGDPQFGIMNSLLAAQMIFKRDIETQIQGALVQMRKRDAAKFGRALAAFTQIAPRMTKGEYDYSFKRGGKNSPAEGVMRKGSPFGQYVHEGGDVILLAANTPLGITRLNADITAYSVANNTPYTYEIKQIYDLSITKTYYGGTWPKVGPGGALARPLSSAEYSAAIQTQQSRLSSIQGSAVSAGFNTPVFAGFFVEGTGQIKTQQIGSYIETMNR